jgi:hypothetical protein
MLLILPFFSESTFSDHVCFDNINDVSDLWFSARTNLRSGNNRICDSFHVCLLCRVFFPPWHRTPRIFGSFFPCIKRGANPCINPICVIFLIPRVKKFTSENLFWQESFRFVQEPITSFRCFNVENLGRTHLDNTSLLWICMEACK